MTPTQRAQHWSGLPRLAPLLGLVPALCAGTPAPTPEPASPAAEIRALREELRQALTAQEQRIQRLEGLVKSLSAPNAAPPAAPMPSPAKAPGSPVTVCAQGCDFHDLQSAVDHAPPGGVLTLAPEINGSCAVINKPLTIRGTKGADGTRAHLAGGACAGKAALVTAAPGIAIEGLEISNIEVGDSNGACVRFDPGTRDPTLRDIYCHDNQEGLIGQVRGRLLVEDSTFEANGFGEGRAHGMYIWGDEALIRRTRILATQNAGHTLKSGLQTLTVENSVLAALNSRNSRALDAYGGGTVVLRGNVIQQGPQSDNSDVIGLAMEPNRLLPGGHSLLMEDNWVIYDAPDRWVKELIRGHKLGPMVVRNNRFVDIGSTGISGAQEEGNQWFHTRKKAGLAAYDGTLASLPKPSGAR